MADEAVALNSGVVSPISELETTLQPLMADETAVISSEVEEELGNDAGDTAEEDASADAPDNKRLQCQAVGCTADLTLDGKYCMKRRLCRHHLKASSVLRKRGGTQLWRFCQQCGKLEPVSEFDGNKRSCRVQLQRRRQSQATAAGVKKCRTSNFSKLSPGCHHHQHGRCKAASAADGGASGQVSLWLEQLAELHNKQQELEQQVIKELQKQQQDVYDPGLDPSTTAGVTATAADAVCQATWLSQPTSLAATAADLGHQAACHTQFNNTHDQSPEAGSDMVSMLRMLLQNRQGDPQNLAPAAGMLPANVEAGPLCQRPAVRAEPARNAFAYGNVQLTAGMHAFASPEQQQAGGFYPATAFQQQQLVPAELIAAVHGRCSAPSCAVGDNTVCSTGGPWMSQHHGCIPAVQDNLHAAGTVGMSTGTPVTPCPGIMLQHIAASYTTAMSAAPGLHRAQQLTCSAGGSGHGAGRNHRAEDFAAGEVAQHAAMSAPPVAASKATTSARPGGAMSMSIEYDSFMKLLEQVPAAASAQGIDSSELAGIIQGALAEVQAGVLHQQQQRDKARQVPGTQETSKTVSNAGASPFATAAVQYTTGPHISTSGTANTGAAAVVTAKEAVADKTSVSAAVQVAAPLAATAPSARLLSLLASSATREQTLDIYGALLASLPGGQPLESYMSFMLAPNSLDSMAQQLESALLQAAAEGPAASEQQEQLNREDLLPVIVPVWKTANQVDAKPPEAAVAAKINAQTAAIGVIEGSVLDLHTEEDPMLSSRGGDNVATAAGMAVAAAPVAARPVGAPTSTMATCHDWRLEWE